MEILDNFISIYCFITFIIGAMFMLVTLCIAAMGKMTEPTNKVHFYVARDKNYNLNLYLGKPKRACYYFLSCTNGSHLGDEMHFHRFGLNYKDFKDLKWEDEPVEVFINMEE